MVSSVVLPTLLVLHHHLNLPTNNPAPCAQPTRVPYGHGGLVGTSFAHQAGGKAQIYLVAPAHRFVEYNDVHWPVVKSARGTP